MSTSALFATTDETLLSGRPHEQGVADEVYFVMYLLDIDDISGENQSFTINIFFRLRWKDERLAHNNEFSITKPLSEVWNPRIILANRQALLRTPMAKVVDIEPDGTVIYRQQYVGSLSQELTLTHFPLDVQDFTIQFIATGFRTDDIEFIPEVISADVNIVGGEIAKTLSLPDWRILDYSAKPYHYVISEALQVPGFAFVFTAKRYVLFYFWQVIFPMILIVMMSWAAFWVDPSLSGTQVSLAASSMLTVIAYRFILSHLLPRLPYMTRMDFFALLSTLMVFLAFTEVIITSLMAKSERPQIALNVDKASRIIFPLVYVIGSVGSFVW